MKYFILAGEASGDLHASNLMKALRQLDTQADFVGLGGDKMRNEGCRLLQDYRKMAFMGVLAVLGNIRQIRANFHIARQGLLDEQPDILILIDYPSFNLKIAKFARQNLPLTKIIYYIPPKIWAWKTFRVHQIARLSDRVLGIFPFEPAFYAQYGYRCEYVGNPTMDAIRTYLTTSPAPTNRENIIAILPGSRRAEIRHCLPKMLAAAREVNQRLNGAYRIVVTAAPGVEDDYYQPFLQDEQLTRNTFQLVRHAAAAVVNSGTATLETALLDCPQTAVYYIACSRWLGWIKPFVFRIPFFTLVNIVPKREVIKEQIAFNFTRDNIAWELYNLLTNETYRLNMLNDYQHIRTILGNQPAAETAAKLIVNILPH